MADEDTRTNFELLNIALHGANMSDEDRRRVLALSWTCDELPPITCSAEYNNYKSLAESINQQLLEADVDVQIWSQDGLLCTALYARMSEWEEVDRSTNP